MDTILQYEAHLMSLSLDVVGRIYDYPLFSASVNYVQTSINKVLVSKSTLYDLFYWVSLGILEA